MRFNVSALSLSIGLFWGVLMLVVGLVNLAWPAYGHDILELVASISPGYRAAASIGQVVMGTLYGLVDGVIAGAVFGGLYNWLSRLLAPPG